ncbi:MAG: outer membrane beta-barrel protein, partial [Tidjanibacter sp.]|nr:outer membrane beta-barrel protein [Tidjanibacter sp.]
MKEDRYDSLEQLLAERLGEFREEPSEGLFDRIEATLAGGVGAAPAVEPFVAEAEPAAPTVEQKPVVVPLWRRPVVRWALSAVVAASLFVGVMLVVDSSAPKEEMVAIEAEINGELGNMPTEEPAELGDDAMMAEQVSMPVARRVATIKSVALTQKAQNEVAEESQPAPQEPTTVAEEENSPKATTTRRTSTRKKQPRKSDEEIEAYWRAVLGLDEEPRRLGLAHPTEISLYAANVGFNQGNMILENVKSNSMGVNEHAVLGGDAGISGPNIFKAPQMNNSLKHFMPVSVGLTASYALADWMALETGLIYTHLHSRSDNEGQMSTYVRKRDMHYLGIPLGVSFRFANFDRWGLYGKLGTTLEHCVSAKDTEFINGKRDKLFDLETPGLQLSLDAVAGVNYMLWGGVGLYGEAGVSYWQSLATHPENYRTENP